MCFLSIVWVSLVSWIFEQREIILEWRCLRNEVEEGIISAGARLLPPGAQNAWVAFLTLLKFNLCGQQKGNSDGASLPKSWSGHFRHSQGHAVGHFRSCLFFLWNICSVEIQMSPCEEALVALEGLLRQATASTLQVRRDQTSSCCQLRASCCEADPQPYSGLRVIPTHWADCWMAP